MGRVPSHFVDLGIDSIDPAYYTVAPMAMGKRRRHGKQASIWVATSELPRSAAHPFSTRLNQILNTHDFDGYVEAALLSVAADWLLRRPGRRARRCLASGPIRLRCASFSLMLPEAPPDHSTISRKVG